MCCTQRYRIIFKVNAVIIGSCRVSRKSDTIWVVTVLVKLNGSKSIGLQQFLLNCVVSLVVWLQNHINNSVVGI